MKTKRNYRQNLFLLTTFLVVASCTTTSKAPKGGVANLIKNYEKSHADNNTQDFSQESESAEADTDNVADDSAVESETVAEETETTSLEKVGPIEIRDNEEVKKWINYFVHKDKERFQRMLNRGAVYRELVQNVLEENGLPKELYYLGLIESGYVTRAKSHASAVGIWQFMKGTAKNYGLNVSGEVDERLDPIRATHAAAKYLRNLYEVFQSWELAMAAYNCGEYRVLGAVMRNGNRDFWYLINNKQLPAETRNYVPKMMAAIIVGEDPEKYGLSIDEDQVEIYPELELVEVASPVSLKQISAHSGIELETLKKYNPNLYRNHTPSNFSQYEVWIPKEKVVQAKQGLANVTPERNIRKRSQERVAETPSSNFYVVKRGDNLGRIAKKVGESVAHLKKINNLRSGQIYPGQRLRIIAPTYAPPAAKYHVVRRGENLGLIARKFGTTVPRLRLLNDLTGNRITVGQRLLLNSPTGPKLASVNSGSSSKKNAHRVRAGENLSKISSRYGISIQQIKRLNRLKGNTVFVGQILRVQH